MENTVNDLLQISTVEPTPSHPPQRPTDFVSNLQHQNGRRPSESAEQRARMLLRNSGSTLPPGFLQAFSFP